MKSKYDWCGCPRSYTGWIVLLVLVVLGVGAGGYFYMRKKKAGDKRRVLNEEAVVAMGDYHHQWSLLLDVVFTLYELYLNLGGKYMGTSANKINLWPFKYWLQKWIINDISVPLDMSKTIITLFLLFLSAIADSTITIHCSLCDNHVCMNVNGGPFTHFSIPYPQKSCSQVGGIVPANYTFTCSSQCPEGCLLTIEERSVRSLCTNEFMTQTVIN